MGLFDKAIERLAVSLAKAAPPPTVSPITQDQIREAMQSYGNSVGLPRDPRLANVPFTPGVPLVPGAINPVGERGRPDPRRYEYQVAQNINITPTRLIPFSTLRAAADQIDIIRRCVEVIKHKMSGLDWDIVLGTDAAEKVMAETGETNYNKAMLIAKDKFSEDINRLKQFWEVPDVSNGLIFRDWLNMALEDVLVLDAWAVWGQSTVGGELKGLQILDGSTIKPLIDDRGMRPTPPHPAFQQILYGFPRSEFSAPDEENTADGEFSADELAYMVRNRRTTSVYGYSPVERSLPLADIYLRRQQWLRSEFTEGVIPDLILKSNGDFTPDQLKAYENILNDYLGGQTEQRKKAHILPQGLDPIAMDGYAEKFSPALDDYLITAICGHFGVQPSEIGMTQAAGLGGGAGTQNGQAESSEVIAIVPLAQWMGSMLSQLSYVWLGMPRELEFKFMPSQRNDEEKEARTNDVKIKGGQLTINEARAKSGLPLIDAPEADYPILVVGAGTYFVTDDGLLPFDEAIVVDESEEAALTKPETPGAIPAVPGVAPAGDETNQPPVDDLENPDEPSETDDEQATDAPEPDEAVEIDGPDEDEEPEDEKKKPIDEKAARNEVYKFMRWVRKNPTGLFTFEHLPETYAATLNKFVAVEDYEGARWYAERYLA
jgi:hypothetical protein